MSSCSKDDSEDSGFSLNVEVVPETAGTVSPGSGTYAQGDVIELNTTAAEGYRFKEWSGDISGKNPFYELTFNSDKHVTAVFEPSLSSRVIGKWQIDADIASSTLDNNKSNKKTPCGIVAIQFNSDGTFIITTNGGEITGAYKFTGADSIELDKAGYLKKIIWENGTLSFDLTLSDCSGNATLVKWATFVPDDVFEQLLIDMGHDDVLDDYVLTENLKQLKKLDYNGEGGNKINYLTGIRDLTELVELRITSNRLSSVDLSQNVNLRTLHLQNNQITSINLSKNIKLHEIFLQNNLIEDVRFSGFKGMIGIILNDNPLRRVELKDISLYQLDIINTSLKKLVLTDFIGGELHVRQNSKLVKIHLISSDLNHIANFSDNNLTELDVSGSPNLEYLTATGNEFSCVTVNADQLNGKEYWKFDEGVTLSLDCE